MRTQVSRLESLESHTPRMPAARVTLTDEELARRLLALHVIVHGKRDAESRELADLLDKLLGEAQEWSTRSTE